MKNHLPYILTFMTAMIAVPLRAAENYGDYQYLEMLTIGKSWEYLSYNPNLPDGGSMSSYTVEVVGDIEIDGKSCKQTKITSSDGLLVSYGAMLEEDKRIYEYDAQEDKFNLMMDFSFTPDTREGFVKDFIEVRGVKRRRLALDVPGFVMCYWVEGIGYSYDNVLSDYERPVGYWTFMLECRQDGETIFTKDDFGLTSVEQPYTPMVVEGRTWWYAYNEWADFNPAWTEYCGITIGGEVERDGAVWNKCHFINKDNEVSEIPLGYVREQDKMVYFLMGEGYADAYPFRYSFYLDGYDYEIAGEEWLIYDFGLQPHDTFLCGPGKEEIKIGEVKYESTEYGDFKTYLNDWEPIVEGVGITDSYYMFCSPHAPVASCWPHPQPTLLWVTEGADNEVYYEAAGGEQPWTTQGVASAVAGGDGEVVSIVDLAGRRVDRPAAGIYIVTTRNADGTLTSRKVAIK